MQAQIIVLRPLFVQFFFFLCRMEHGDGGRLGIQAGIAYAITQLGQMILTATFVPSLDPGSFYLSQECMKAFISLGDVLGLYYLFQAKRTSHMAVLIGLSWATTESLLRRLIPLCIEARSMQASSP